MKQEISNKINEEYKTLRDELTEIEKELDAVGKSTKENKLGCALLFGVFPSLLAAFALSRLYVAGIIDASLLSLLSTAGTIAISGTSLALFEKKWDYKKTLKEYNVPSSIKEKIEREVELEQEKKQIEVKMNILKSYYEEINDERFEFVNEGYDKEEVEEEVEANLERVEAVANRQYIYDKFAEYNEGRKNTGSSIAKGAIIGLLLSSSIMYLPQIMGGIGVASIVTTPLTIAISTLTAGVFATYNGIKSNVMTKIYKKKNKELGSLEIPSGREPLYIENYRLVSNAVNDYKNSLRKKDALNVEVTPKKQEIIDVEETIDNSLVKEDIVKLEKKL